MTSSLQSYSTRQFLRIHWILLFCWWQDLSFLLFSSRVYWFFITRFSSARDYISTNNFTISGRIISETDRVISIKFRLQSVNKGMFQMTLLWISLLCLSRKIISVPQIVYCEVFGHLNDKTFCLTSYILSQSPHDRKIVQKYSPVIQTWSSINECQIRLSLCMALKRFLRIFFRIFFAPWRRYREIRRKRPIYQQLK